MYHYRLVLPHGQGTLVCLEETPKCPKGLKLLELKWRVVCKLHSLLEEPRIKWDLPLLVHHQLRRRGLLLTLITCSTAFLAMQTKIGPRLPAYSMTNSQIFLTYLRSVSATIFFIREDETRLALEGVLQTQSGISTDRKHLMMYLVPPCLEEALRDREEILQLFLAFCAPVTQFWTTL